MLEIAKRIRVVLFVKGKIKELAIAEICSYSSE